MASAPQVPPLSPLWLAGVAAGPLPPALFQPFVGRVLDVLRRRHPEVFARLEPLGDRSVLIAPVDLPFRFLLRPNRRPPRLEVLAPGGSGEDDASATIRGPLARLLELAQGRVDGDALFFARDISVLGDTEVVVALRNALDGAEVDVLETLCCACGPLAPLARRLAPPGLALADRAARHLSLLQAAINGPVARRCDAQETALADLRARLIEVERRVARRGPRAAPAPGAAEP